MDMKALNLQNRTFAIIENGSWAVKSGDAANGVITIGDIQAFIQ